MRPQPRPAATRDRDGHDPGQIKLKRYFYALRPALALAWQRNRPRDAQPIALHELMAGLDLAPAFRAAVDELVEHKRRTRELGFGPRVPELDRFIYAEFAAAAVRPGDHVAPMPCAVADAVFRSILD